MSKDQDHRNVATYILGTANKVVTTERGGQHGGAEDSFQMIADLWSTYLSNTNTMGAMRGSVLINPKDVAQMMVLLKIARNVHGQLKDDDFVDQAGYTALAGALAGIQTPPPAPIATSEVKYPMDPATKTRAEVEALKNKQQSDILNDLARKNKEKDETKAMAERLAPRVPVPPAPNPQPVAAQPASPLERVLGQLDAEITDNA